jgi:hypothetical protein
MTIISCNPWDSVGAVANVPGARNDFEADLEFAFASGSTLILDDVVYEQHMAEVAVVDRAMVGFNGSHLVLIDRLLKPTRTCCGPLMGLRPLPSG